MVQADDWIFPRCLEDMVAVAERDASIAIVGSFHFYGSRLLFTEMPLDTAVFEGRDICRRQLLAHHYFMGNPTTLLYRSKCTRQRVPFFEPGRFGDDLEVCFDLLRDHRFGFVPQVLSYVRLRSDSIMGQRDHYDPIATSYYTTVKDYGPEYLSADEYRLLEAAVARNYWRRLGRAALVGRGRAYWDFHRARLAEIGETIRWSRVAAGAARVALHALLHPGWAFETVRDEIGRSTRRHGSRIAPAWGLG
jgi:hypothetical protein